jgi:multiple sugar transport system ATP-binding protein
MAAISLKQVSKSYGGDVMALEASDLEIYDGEFMVLLGPSGCGKSTTLRLIAGLETPTSGEIFIDQKLMNHVEPNERNIAMVFQNYALYPHMSVHDNMAFALKLKKIPKQTIENKISEVSQSLGLSDVLKRKPKALSGGQQQRVALGRAIVREPQVFLFDEPLSNLDARLRVDMRKELTQLHQKLNTTVVFVTHDQTEAMTMGSRICVMNRGKIQQIGSPLEIYHKPANTFVAQFIGSPAMNIFRGHMKDATFTQNDLELNINLENDAHHPHYLGIRPEKLSLDHDSTKSNYKIEAKIHLIEHLGSEQLLYLQKNNCSFILKSTSESDFKTGQTIKLYVPKDALHFFDQHQQRIPD